MAKQVGFVWLLELQLTFPVVGILQACCHEGISIRQSDTTIMEDLILTKQSGPSAVKSLAYFLL